MLLLVLLIVIVLFGKCECSLRMFVVPALAGDSDNNPPPYISFDYG